jgi:hypothetical protein
MDRTRCDRSDRSRHLRGLTTSSPRSGQAAICCPYRSVRRSLFSRGRDQLSSSSIATKATTTDRQLGSHYRVRSPNGGCPTSRSAQRLFAVDSHTRTRGIDSVRLKGTRFKLSTVRAL